jgi:alkylated DNA nucleotide flippase Atl1
VNQVKNKYRGTVDYHRVFGKLITAAEHCGTVTYQEIAQLMGLPLVGDYMGREVGQILGEISEDEHDRQRPLLSAVAVKTTGRPGPGFADLARQLGRLRDTSKETEERFWNEEKDRVYETWKRPLKAGK